MRRPPHSDALIAALARSVRRSGLRGDALVALQQGAFRPELDVTQLPAKARIRCPHCNWQPKRSSRWWCLPAGSPEFFMEGCGHAWNTFDTRGKCPSCGYQWRNTSCLACGAWSRHEDWYEPLPEAGDGKRRRK